MITNLLPRLSTLAVSNSLEKLNELIISADSLPNQYDLSQVKFASSGGSKVSNSKLDMLKENLTDIAKANGFPGKGTAKTRAKFDLETSIYLSSEELFSSGEALRNDVWSFVATELVPELVIWRFKPKTTNDKFKLDSNRFKGGIRNTFQRLWIRSKLFDLGPTHTSRWQLLELLTEDALVQITERASIAMYRNVSQTIATCWLISIRKPQNIHLESERIMRDAIALIRFEGEIFQLSKLPDSILKGIIQKQFLRAEKLQNTKIKS
ncbi:hypothetical protein ACTACN_21990 [Pseudomonas syringae]|uniref:hypothetical protein n=1 Tax=Pseudomonas syringae TaxID=317 RepID=UPI0012FE655B